jgi:hypothetical protein
MWGRRCILVVVVVPIVITTPPPARRASTSNGVATPVRLAYQPAVLFSQNKPSTNNQPTVFFSQNKSAPAISH